MRKMMLAAALAGALLTGAPTLARDEQPVKVTQPAAIRGLQRVVIGGFTIGFLNERRDNAHAGGGLLGGTRHDVQTKSVMAGVGDADFQTVVDAAYADFVQRLTAAGIEVVARDGLLADARFAAVSPTAAPYRTGLAVGRDDKAKAVLFSAGATQPLRLFAGDLTSTGLGEIGRVMAAGRTNMAAQQFAQAGGVPVISVIYLVNFADKDEASGWFRSRASVSVRPAVGLLPTNSHLTLIAPTGKVATLSLNETVAAEGDFATIADTTSGGARTAETIGNIISVLGGGGTNKSRTKTFTVQPAAWVPLATAATGQANERLVTTLAGLR